MCQARSRNTCICDMKIFGQKSRRKEKKKTNYIQIEIYKRYQRNARKYACELCARPCDQSLLYMCVTLQDYTECASDTWNVRPETFIYRFVSVRAELSRTLSLDAKDGFLCGHRDQNSFEYDPNNCIYLRVIRVAS